MDVDPPCDLLIEVDLTTDSSGRFPLFAALRVPEVWRYDGSLSIWTLEGKKYTRRHASRALPLISDKVISELLTVRQDMTRPAWLRLIRQRIRTLIEAGPA